MYTLKQLYKDMRPKTQSDYDYKLSRRLECLAHMQTAKKAYYEQFPTSQERWANSPKDVWHFQAEARRFQTTNYTLITPWGKADSIYCEWIEIDGSHITIVGTPSHGGWRVTGSLLKLMPTALKAIGDKGWFEEDCAWSAVPVGLPHLFDPQTVTEARETLMRWYPEALAEVA